MGPTTTVLLAIVMDKDRAGPQVKILNWGKAIFDGTRLEPATVPLKQSCRE